MATLSGKIRSILQIRVLRFGEMKNLPQDKQADLIQSPCLFRYMWPLNHVAADSEELWASPTSQSPGTPHSPSLYHMET